MNPKLKILVIEDDPHIQLGLTEILKSEGYEVDVCSQGDKALAQIIRTDPQLVLLDIMLPGKSGYDICREVRAHNIETPILVLTAKSQEIDKVVGLDLGADDYVTKPFGVRELLARVKALLRRIHPISKEPGASQELVQEESFRMGKSMVDPKRYEITYEGIVEKLTPRELKLLIFLHQHPDEVLSRDRLLNEVWGYNYFGTTRTLDQTVAQLRKKIGDNAAESKYLSTIHGVGYQWHPRGS